MPTVAAQTTARALMVLLLALLAVGCTARVEAPRQLAEAERVWLLQFAYHSTLIFREKPGAVVLYEYGEWEWYAMNRTAWTRVFPVFLWPTTGSLSRRQLALEEPIATRDLVHAMMANKGWAIDVERADAVALRETLNERYAEGRSQEHYDAYLDTYFVPDPAPYHALRTCNSVMAQWLRDLGCTVRGFLWSWKWRVYDSPDAYDDGATPNNAGIPDSASLLLRPMVENSSVAHRLLP